MRLIKLNLCFYLLGKGKHESQPWTKQQQIFWNFKGQPDISLKAQATLMAKCFVQGLQHVFYQIRIAHANEFSETNGIAITVCALHFNCQTKDGNKAEAHIKLD